MTRLELLNQVAEKLERCEYTPIVTAKEELPIWAMLLNKVYEETFNTEECTFYPTMNTSSATICGACGKEKFEHKL